MDYMVQTRVAGFSDDGSGAHGAGWAAVGGVAGGLR